mmetsp:Transcript_7580/g.13216  ORF Transcript_7580/g.13216 Transcript_7580/m.13216 type:complete len:782 (+) Transcript_7580:21-2366(+)
MSETEQVVFSDIAGVFQLNGSVWTALDRGVSRVCIFQSTQLRVIALSSDRQHVLNHWLPEASKAQQINEAFVAWVDGTDSFGLNFHSAAACTSFIMAWKQPLSTNANQLSAPNASPNSPALPVPYAPKPVLPKIEKKEHKSSYVAPVVKKVNAKEALKKDHDPEIDDNAEPISFARGVHRVEEGLRALLTAANNTVKNPSYNYDNRTQAAIVYLHQATCALLKLFIAKITARRKKSETPNEKGVVEKTLRLVYYLVHNTPTRGKTEEWTLKAAVGVRRRLVLRILSLRLRDDFNASLYLGHQMLSALNAIKLIEPRSTQHGRAESTCMLQMCAVISTFTKQLTRVADCIACFGHIARDDDYKSIAADTDEEIAQMPFWNECANQTFTEGQKGYTLNQLVLKLTDDASYDRKFMQTFTTTYQSFTVPTLLLQKLMERYQVPGNVGVDDKRRQAIQLRVAVVLKYWTDQHFEHFDEEVLQNLYTFLTQYLTKDGHVDMAKALHAFISNKAKERDEQTVAAFRVPKTIFPAKHKENPNATVSPVALWYKMDVDLMAKIITAIDFELYSKVQPTELLNQAWNDRKLKWRAPHLLAMAHRSTAISYWVATCVLCQAKLEERVFMMSKFVQLGEELRLLNNYQSLMAILAGLNTSAVHRMNRHWDSLPKKKLKLWDDLNDLMSSDNSFKLYRQALDEASLPALPYVGVHLTDLFFKEDANPDMVEDKINYRKRELVYESIEHIQRFQAVPYQFDKPEPASTFLRNPASLGEDLLYELSLFFEPRQSN